jgi:hypothetical protein
MVDRKPRFVKKYENFIALYLIILPHGTVMHKSFFLSRKKYSDRAIYGNRILIYSSSLYVMLTSSGSLYRALTSLPMLALELAALSIM